MSLDGLSLRGISTSGADATNDTPRYNTTSGRLEYAPAGTVDSVVAGTGVTVDATDPANPVVSAAGGGGSGLFRGEWSGSTVGLSLDFTSGTWPSQLAKDNSVGRMTFSMVPTTSMTNNPGPFTNPPADAYSAHLYWAGGTSGTDGVVLDLSTLSLSGSVVSVRSYLAGQSACRPFDMQILKNGVAGTTVNVPNNTTTWGATKVGWDAYETPAVETDVLEWAIKNSNGGYSLLGHMYLTGVDIMVASNPYSSGQYVTHLGRLWRCLTDGTAQEPGAGADWSEVPIGYDQAVATGSRPTGITAGAQVFDTTLGKPVWYNGTGWVDATGATV